MNNYHFADPSEENISKRSIEIATLPAGMYLIKAEGKVYKFTKQ